MSGIVGQNLGRASGLIKSGGVGADSVTGASIADNAVDSEHYTDGSIDTAHVGASQITNAEIADMAATKLTGSIADARVPASAVTQHVDLTALSASNLTSGTIPDARFTTLPSVSGANLTSLNGSNISSGTVADARISALTSSKLTGALPALDGSSLTGVGGSTTHLAVGTYTLSFYRISGNFSVGGTTGGGNLGYRTGHDYSFIVKTSSTNTTLSGTWRLMNHHGVRAPSGNWPTCLVVRTA